MKHARPPFGLKRILAVAFLTALFVLTFLHECSGQRVSDVGISRYSLSGFMLSYRNMRSDSNNFDMGAEFLFGGSSMQVSNFTEPSSQDWKHLILGGALIAHGPRWQDSHLLGYGKLQGLMVIGQDDIPPPLGDLGEGSANLTIISALVGFDYAITPRLSISGEIGPALEWANFNGELSFLNDVPFSDKSEFKPITFSFRFSMAFSDLISSAN